MKPGSPKRSIPKLRPLHSLYLHSTLPGKNEANSTRFPGRKTMFKPPRNNLKLKSNLGLTSTTISRRTQSGLNKNDTMKLSRALALNKKEEQCPLVDSFFFRPSGGVREIQRKMMERANRMGELARSEGKSGKNLNHIIKKSPTVPCTPKPSGLSAAYIKLSSYKKKPGTLKKAAFSSTTFDESIIHRKQVGMNKVTNMDQDKNLQVANIDPINSNNEKLTNRSNKDNIKTVKEISSDCSLNMDDKSQKVDDNQTANPHVIGNVLKHWKDYAAKILAVNEAMNVLDSNFQSTIIGNLDSSFKKTFFDYQKKKRELFREMEKLEEELEDSVQNELNVESKIEKYLAKKRNLLKKRRNIDENLEKRLLEMTENYEKELAKSEEKVESLGEVIKALGPACKSEKDKSAKPVLRRSKRLLMAEEENAKLRGSASKKEETIKVRDKDDSIVKRGRRSRDKRMQYCMYKDLQKSFNLCSPECSF